MELPVPDGSTWTPSLQPPPEYTAKKTKEHDPSALKEATEDETDKSTDLRPDHDLDATDSTEDDSDQLKESTEDGSDGSMECDNRYRLLFLDFLEAMLRGVVDSEQTGDYVLHCLERSLDERSKDPKSVQKIRKFMLMEGDKPGAINTWTEIQQEIVEEAVMIKGDVLVSLPENETCDTRPPNRSFVISVADNPEEVQKMKELLILAEQPEAINIFANITAECSSGRGTTEWGQGPSTGETGTQDSHVSKGETAMLEDASKEPMENDARTKGFLQEHERAVPTVDQNTPPSKRRRHSF